MAAKTSPPIILSESEIREQLKDLPNWSYGDNKLKRELEFKKFMDVINFVDNLAPFFEKIDHHADMHILYTKLIFELQRFDVGGKITDKDFIAARKIEERAAELGL